MKNQKKTGVSKTASASSNAKSYMKQSIGLASNVTMSRGGGGDRIRNKDLIINVTNTLGTVRIPCNPRFWPNTMAYLHSLGYQTYRPNAIRVHWRPAVAATTAGQVVGGSLSFRQEISTTLLANALMASPGSRAGPVWENLQFSMDLSLLTQQKYFLNETNEDGIPVDLFIILPDSAVGFLEVEYDINYFGPSTQPVNPLRYDLIPLVYASGTSTEAAGACPSNKLIADKNYELTFSSSPVNETLEQTSTSGGTGNVVIRSNFNSSCVVRGGASADLVKMIDSDNATYPTPATAGHTIYVWFSDLTM